MIIYTYVVNHGKDRPAVGAGTKINGGVIQSVMFDDAITKLEEIEDFINDLRARTTCDSTKYAIDDFMN